MEADPVVANAEAVFGRVDPLERNAAECGGFDLTDVWGVDTGIAVDMLRVFAMLAAHQHYPDALGYGKHFEAIVRAWRPTPTAQR